VRLGYKAVTNADGRYFERSQQNDLASIAFNGATENARKENVTQSTMQGWKIQDWKRGNKLQTWETRLEN